MFSALSLAKDEPPIASVYLTDARLRLALRPILGQPHEYVGSAIDTELRNRQRPDGSWLPEELDACGFLNQKALAAYLIACGVDKFHPQVHVDLQVAFATLIGFLRVLMTGDFGFVHMEMGQLRSQLSDPALEAAEAAFKWLVRFGAAYPDMTTRLGLAPSIGSFCAVLHEALVSLERLRRQK